MYINKKWDNYLEDEFSKEYFKLLMQEVVEKYKSDTIYPTFDNIFATFKNVEPDEVKVVIIGQDPYHGENQANGMSFSVSNNVVRPPSLVNIFKELKNDLNIERVDNDLTDWNKQGVLLLNSLLTVERNKPLSHQYLEWERFTDTIIKKLNCNSKPIIFVLWGNNAKKKKILINTNIHYIIESSHPSPLSAYRGFLGSKPFSQINNILIKNNFTKIDW